MQRDLGLFALRAALGAIFVAHAADKLGWYSISIFFSEDNLVLYTKQALSSYHSLVEGIFPNLEPPQILALTAISALLEFICGWLILIGLLSQVAALYLTVMMSVAVHFHWSYGFFASEGGYEWAMLCLGGSICIMLSGAGAFSLTQIIRSITTTESQAL